MDTISENSKWQKSELWGSYAADRPKAGWRLRPVSAEALARSHRWPLRYCKVQAQSAVRFRVGAVHWENMCASTLFRLPIIGIVALPEIMPLCGSAHPGDRELKQCTDIWMVHAIELRVTPGPPQNGEPTGQHSTPWQSHESTERLPCTEARPGITLIPYLRQSTR